MSKLVIKRIVSDLQDINFINPSCMRMSPIKDK